jgi:3-hydroxyisobutyrate dehydrogenase-like beta-hydroxyacid dehydrogenase
MTSPRICLIGLGEVGRILAEDLRAHAGEIRAWDIQFPDARSRPSATAVALAIDVPRDAAEAVRGAELVISAVTAAQCVAAARAVAPHLASGAWYLDLNSVSPGSRQQAAAAVRAAGARYVEAAVMSPILPRRIASPMLLGGADAAGFLAAFAGLGFSGAQAFSSEIGAASAAKMCRSVIVKGLEALVLESLLSARHFGVEATVIDSLRDWLGSHSDGSFAHYSLSRALIHGRRRAEEMREAARSVREAGLEPRMSAACAEWQDWAGGRWARVAELPLPALLDELRADARREVA